MANLAFQSLLYLRGVASCLDFGFVLFGSFIAAGYRIRRSRKKLSSNKLQERMCIAKVVS